MEHSTLGPSQGVTFSASPSTHKAGRKGAHGFSLSCLQASLQGACGRKLGDPVWGASSNTPSVHGVTQKYTIILSLGLVGTRILRFGKVAIALLWLLCQASVIFKVFNIPSHTVQSPVSSWGHATETHTLPAPTNMSVCPKGK